jgi:hypothetical protein
MIEVVARARLQRRGVQLEWFTVGWNVIEAAVAITAGLIAGSVALVGMLAGRASCRFRLVVGSRDRSAGDASGNPLAGVGDDGA